MPNTTVKVVRARRAPVVRTFDKAQDAWEFVDDMLIRECLSSRAVSHGSSPYQITINTVGRRQVPRAAAGMA